MILTANKIVQLPDGLYQVTLGLDLICPDGRKITKKDMAEIAEQYKGINRIHKPMALLFWTDVKNGQYSNWK